MTRCRYCDQPHVRHLQGTGFWYPVVGRLLPPIDGHLHRDDLPSLLSQVARRVSWPAHIQHGQLQAWPNSAPRHARVLTLQVCVNKKPASWPVHLAYVHPAAIVCNPPNPPVTSSVPNLCRACDQLLPGMEAHEWAGARLQCRGLNSCADFREYQRWMGGMALRGEDKGCLLDALLRTSDARTVPLCHHQRGTAQ